MAIRSNWVERVEQAWKKRSIVWLTGVRRAGKTLLSRSLPDVEYFDCELPTQVRKMEDPEEFLAAWNGKKLVLDEIHRLQDPSRLLKIAADHFPETRILATGSSTLNASAKFSDTLTGRKFELWLTPMDGADRKVFPKKDLKHRLLHGGLPPFFLSESFPETEIREWMDAYWARDILELFRLEKKAPFEKFLELMMAQSGGIFEATRFARPCEVSRNTIMNYLSAMEATHVAHVLRPFSSGRSAEIISAPKVYGFDTGFVSFFKGWTELRREDLGTLWEHYVLNEMHSGLQTRRIQYWRDKQGHEVDFVLVPRGRKPVAVECKWRAEEFSDRNLRIFHQHHEPESCYVVCQNVDAPYQRKFGDMTVRFTGLADLVRRLRELPL